MEPDRIERALWKLTGKVDAILDNPEALRAVHTDQGALMGLALVLGTSELFGRLLRMGQLAQDEETTLAQIANIERHLDDVLMNPELLRGPPTGPA